VATVLNPVRTPEVITYLHEALPLSLISQDCNYLPWFCGNYIQLLWLATKRQVPLDFYTVEPYEILANPWLDTRLISSDMVDWFGANAETFAMRAIDQGFSLYSGLDEYYIPDSFSFGKYHTNHANLIYGYNSDEKFFYALGYSRFGQYRAYRLLFKEFSLAFHNLEFQPQGAVRMINLLRFDNEREYKHAVSKELDLELVGQFMSDYLESRNSSLRFRKLRPPVDGVYGMAIYEELCSWVKSLAPHTFIDHRPLRLLWEHKKCMVIRLNYFFSQGILPTEFDLASYKAVERAANRARIQLIKFSLTDDSRLVDSILKELDFIREQELALLPVVLKSISGTYSH
jgi:hypothetical protein